MSGLAVDELTDAIRVVCCQAFLDVVGVGGTKRWLQRWVGAREALAADPGSAELLAACAAVENERLPAFVTAQLHVPEDTTQYQFVKHMFIKTYSEEVWSAVLEDPRVLLTALIHVHLDHIKAKARRLLPHAAAAHNRSSLIGVPSLVVLQAHELLQWLEAGLNKQKARKLAHFVKLLLNGDLGPHPARAAALAHEMCRRLEWFTAHAQQQPAAADQRLQAGAPLSSVDQAAAALPLEQTAPPGELAWFIEQLASTPRKMLAIELGEMGAPPQLVRDIIESTELRLAVGARKEWGASAYPPPELADHLWRLKEQVAAAHWQRTRGSYDYATENELWFLQCQHACHLLFFCSHEWAAIYSEYGQPLDVLAHRLRQHTKGLMDAEPYNASAPGQPPTCWYDNTGIVRPLDLITPDPDYTADDQAAGEAAAAEEAAAAAAQAAAAAIATLRLSAMQAARKAALCWVHMYQILHVARWLLLRDIRQAGARLCIAEGLVDDICAEASDEFWETVDSLLTITGFAEIEAIITAVRLKRSRTEAAGAQQRAAVAAHAATELEAWRRQQQQQQEYQEGASLSPAAVLALARLGPLLQQYAGLAEALAAACRGRLHDSAVGQTSAASLEGALLLRALYPPPQQQVPRGSAAAVAVALVDDGNAYCMQIAASKACVVEAITALDPERRRQLAAVVAVEQRAMVLAQQALRR